MLEDNDAHNKIAVITVDGIITSHDADPAGNNMVDVIKAQLDRAKDDKRVKAVILKGGFARRRSDGVGRNQQDCSQNSRSDSEGQAGDLFDGQPGGERRLLHFRAVPLDCRR